MGDPRDRIVHSSVKIFDRSRENENFIIDDTNWKIFYNLDLYLNLYVLFYFVSSVILTYFCLPF